MKKDHAVKKQREPILWILLLLASFASIAAVLFTPALPELTQKLHITPAQAQFTITIFLLGCSIGSLPYGPLSNRFGRKFTIYIGIVLALIGTVLIVLVNTLPLFWLLILGRFLLALGSSVGVTIAFTMVGDVYQKKTLAKKISYFMFMVAVGPSLSIVLGGFLTTHFGWVSCFYFLIAYALVLLFATTFLPETIKEVDRDALSITKIKEGYVAKLKNKKVVVASILMGCAGFTVYLFASEAPFIAINHLGLAPDTYGLFNFIPPIGLVVGSSLANFFAGKKEPINLILLGTCISFISAVAMLVLFLFVGVTVWTLFIPMPFIYSGVSLVLSNCSSIAMSYARNKANGSAVMIFLNVGTNVVLLLSVEAIALHQNFLMPITFMSVFFLIFFIRKYLSHIICQSEKS